MADTIVCRCEEFTAATIRQSLNDGAIGPCKIKTATRAGMGPCQGRMCDLSVRAIVASQDTLPVPPRARSPIKPVTFGELPKLSVEEKIACNSRQKAASLTYRPSPCLLT